MRKGEVALGVAGLSMACGAAGASINVAYSGMITFSQSEMVMVGEAFNIETMIDPALPDLNPDPAVGGWSDPWMWHWTQWDWLRRFDIDLDVPTNRVVLTAVFEEDSMGPSALGTIFVSTFNFEPGTLTSDTLGDVPFDTAFLSALTPSTFQVFEPTGLLLIEGVITTVTPAPGGFVAGLVAMGVLGARRRR